MLRQGVAAHGVRDLDAAHSRHAVVGDHESKVFAHHPLERLAAVGRSHDTVAITFQILRADGPRAALMPRFGTAREHQAREARIARKMTAESLDQFNAIHLGHLDVRDPEIGCIRVEFLGNPRRFRELVHEGFECGVRS